MLPDRVSNPGPLTYESGVVPIALRSPADPDQTVPIICIFKMYGCTSIFFRHVFKGGQFS